MERAHQITNGHKLGLLYTMKYLLEETDDGHAVNASDISAYLKRAGLAADRRTIYADVEILRDFGLDILTKDTGNLGGYYIGSREFELPELKLLVDAVQCSKFITVRKSGELIAKLSSLTSKSNAGQLEREVFITGRGKTENENILYNVDSIYEAMNEDLQIAFQYGEYTPQKHLVPRKGGARYQVSPWGLAWDDEYYYMAAYDDMAEMMKHYRVDKMLKTRVTQEKRTGGEKYNHYDMAALSRKTFGMFGGEDTTVTLVCEDGLAGVIVDRFGNDAKLIPGKNGYFTVEAIVAVSPQFYGWVAAIGPGMEITAPEHVRTEFQTYLKNILKKYDTVHL